MLEFDAISGLPISSITAKVADDGAKVPHGPTHRKSRKQFFHQFPAPPSGHAAPVVNLLRARVAKSPIPSALLDGRVRRGYHYSTIILVGNVLSRVVRQRPPAEAITGSARRGLAHHTGLTPSPVALSRHPGRGLAVSPQAAPFPGLARSGRVHHTGLSEIPIAPPWQWSKTFTPSPHAGSAQAGIVHHTGQSSLPLAPPRRWGKSPQPEPFPGKAFSGRLYHMGLANISRVFSWRWARSAETPLFVMFAGQGRWLAMESPIIPPRRISPCGVARWEGVVNFPGSARRGKLPVGDQEGNLPVRQESHAALLEAPLGNLLDGRARRGLLFHTGLVGHEEAPVCPYRPHSTDEALDRPDRPDASQEERRPLPEATSEARPRKQEGADARRTRIDSDEDTRRKRPDQCR